MDQYVFNYGIKVIINNSIFLDIPVEGEKSNFELMSSMDMIEAIYYLAELGPSYISSEISEFIESNILVNVDLNHSPLNSAFSIYNYSRTLSKNEKFNKRISRCGKYEIKIIDNLYLDSVNREVSTWIDTLPFKRVDIDSNESRCNLHWVHYLSPVNMNIKSIPFLRALNNYIINNHLGCYYELARAHIYNGSNEDVYTKHRDSQYNEDITVVYYPGEWESNWGGELLFYSNQETDTAVEIKEGRVIIFNGYQEHRISPISRSAKQSRRSIVIRYKKKSST